MKLKIAERQYDNFLIQGPLAGYSCAPFRSLTWQYSQPAFSCTEMISSKALIHQPKRAVERYIKKASDEGPVCFQLAGNDAKDLALAAKIVTDHGADFIDLNCGCPVNKIRRKGMGSSLLAVPNQLAELITAIKNNTHVPVSIKIRVQDDDEGQINENLVTMIRQSPLDFIIVHGRHWTENYDNPCRYDQIKFFVDQLTIPVIGNGDIACLASLRAMQETGCAGAMIARAGVGQPWLIRQLNCELKGEIFKKPAPNEIGAIFLQHISQLIALLQNEKFAILQSRKLIKYYAREVEMKAMLMSAVNNCQSFEDLILLVNRYF